MKLGKDVLVEIMAILQRALLHQEDASQALRDLDLVEHEEEDGTKVLVLNKVCKGFEGP